MKLKLLTIVMAMITTIATAAELNVVPAVQQWMPGTGTLQGKGEIVCTSEGSDSSKPEGYIVEITARQIIIRAATPVGLAYGKTTLEQLRRQNPVLPQGKIVDWPDSPRRMLMLDVGRKPFPMPVLKDYLRILAWYKMNELHLHLSDEAFGGKYTGFRVQCDTFPGLASKDLFYTKKELRELQDEAKTLGITITPEIDMPGHSRVFTDYWPDIMVKGNHGYMDVTNPKTIERMKQLLDEMIPIFDAPDFHIGTDEYRVGGPDKEKMMVAFREFINTMNAHIRSKGKNCRIWSGFEHMGGKEVKIDPTVIIDMWDPYNPEHDGHPVINSSQFVTYYVPGAHYYGVSPGGLYNGFEPWHQGCPTAPKKGDPRLLGGKLHVWCDQGPTGYDHTEIATLVLPGLQAISEKLWGTKGSNDYADFQKRAALTLPIPGVTVFNRMPAAKNEVVFSFTGVRNLTTTNSVIPLLQGRNDLEWPWTLTMEVCKTAETGGRGVILSSDLVEICSEFARTEEIKKKDAAGKEVKEKVTRQGIGIIRAAGSAGADPASSMKVNQVSHVYTSPATSHLMHDVSHAYGDALPLNKWVTLTIVGDRGHTALYVNGQLTGDHNDQMVCPLAQLGSKTGNSFVGKIRNLKVLNYALAAKEIGRAAGLDIPDNLAAHKPATASRSDTGYGFTPENLTDENPATRWSSGQGGAETWVAIDLGKPVEFNTVTVAWENARANKLRVQVSNDGQVWRDVVTVEVTGPDTVVTFPRQRARQVRLVMNEAATGWGYSIWGVEVLNKRT